MQKQTGLKVNAFFATDYTGIIEAQRFNKIQVAWYGNKSAIEAVDRANGEVFAQFIDLHGTPGYYSYIITHKDSPLNSLDDMLKNGKNLTFGSGDPQSTSGTLVPGYYVFAQRGLEAKNVFKVVRPASHGVNLLAVLNKQVDVATNNSEELDKLQLKDPEKRKEVKILWTSPLIPRDPLVWRKDLPDDTKKKIKAFIVGYGKDEREKDDPEGHAADRRLPESSRRAADADPPARAAPRTAQASQTDTTLSDAEKRGEAQGRSTRKLAELAKLAK